MGPFDEVLNDVGAHVAAMFPAPPPAIRAAVDNVARALLGESQAAARISTLAARAPRLQSLFGAVHRGLLDHPHFQHALHAAHLHRHPLAPSHPQARAIHLGVREAMHGIDTALPGFLHAVNTAKREEALRHEAGRLHGTAHGGAHHMHARPSHGTRHGHGWRHLHPEPPPRVFWEGPWGWGADYILDEREELGDVATPDDGEPEWREGAPGPGRD
jgi:hypothetical protein